MDRDPDKFTLWWTSGDKQACMWFGNFESEADAESAIPAADAEYRSMCSEDSPYDQESIWTIEPPTEE